MLFLLMVNHMVILFHQGVSDKETFFLFTFSFFMHRALHLYYRRQNSRAEFMGYQYVKEHQQFLIFSLLMILYFFVMPINMK